MGLSREAQLEQYCDAMVATLAQADRERPARWYLKGLLLPGGRKSVEPMAARVPQQRRRMIGSVIFLSRCHGRP